MGKLYNKDLADKKESINRKLYENDVERRKGQKNLQASEDRLITLERAKNYIENARLEAEQLRRRVRDLSAGEWAGDNWNTFENLAHNFPAYNDVNSLVFNLINFEGSLDNQIAQERKNKDVLTQLLDTLKCNYFKLTEDLTSLGNEIQNQ